MYGFLRRVLLDEMGKMFPPVIVRVVRFSEIKPSQQAPSSDDTRRGGEAKRVNPCMLMRASRVTMGLQWGGGRAGSLGQGWARRGTLLPLHFVVIIYCAAIE